MRKSVFLALCILCMQASKAQFTVAVVAGPQGSSTSPNFVQNHDTVPTSVSQRSGIRFGFIANLPFSTTSHLYFQSGIVYSAKGSQVLQTYNGTSEYKSVTTDLVANYIDMPLNLLYKIPIKGKTKFVLSAGPQLSLFYNGSVSSSSIDTFGKYTQTSNKDLAVGNKNEAFKVVHVAYNVSGGFEFGRVFLTGNYSSGLTNFYEDATAGYKHTTMGASLGIYLGKQNTGKPVAKKVVVKDSDHDGIPDNEDGCPLQAGSKLTNGCPDKDGDGIADKVDACPTLAGTAANKGCPILDRDGDGIVDKDDKCPDVAGLAKYGGCPVPDTDKDGVNDEEDKCINEPGTKENSGCPVVSTELVKKINTAARQIQFAFQKNVLTPEAYKTLDEVAQILAENPKLHLIIEGHTSGNYDAAAANLKLSQDRADNVKTYLVNKHIDASRITAIGYGSTRPLTESTDPKEVAKNRRVELKLSY